MSRPLSDNREFYRFASSAGEPPPPVAPALRDEIANDLEPGFARVLGRLFGIHALTALVTLSICPQFGFRVWGEGMGISHWFMAFGEVGCTVACGFFFMAVSWTLAAFVLKGEEIRAIRRSYPLQISSVLLLSLGFFLMTGAELWLGLAGAWALGAALGSLVPMEFGWRLRFAVARSLR